MQRLSTLASEHVSTLREELDTFGIHVIKAPPVVRPLSTLAAIMRLREMRAIDASTSEHLASRMRDLGVQPIPIRTTS